MTTKSCRWEREPSRLICLVAEGERRRRSSLAWQAKAFSSEFGTLASRLVQVRVQVACPLLREAGHALELLAGGAEHGLGRAEVLEQRALARRADPGQVVHDRL